MVLGIHQYYRIATYINQDCNCIARQINHVLKNRLWSLSKKKPTAKIVNGKGDVMAHYYKSKQMRYLGQNAILPISYVQTKDALHKKRSVNKYTSEGREEIHKALGVNMAVLHLLMRYPAAGRSIEYADNRISLYAAQYGRCAVTGLELTFDEIHCHHKFPCVLDGSDAYQNLVIVHVNAHRLIHASQQEMIDLYMQNLKLNKTMLTKLNKLRLMAGNTAI